MKTTNTGINIKEAYFQKLERENSMLKQMIDLLEKRQTMCFECPHKEIERNQAQRIGGGKVISMYR